MQMIWCSSARRLSVLKMKLNMQLRADALDGIWRKRLSALYVITSDEHLLAMEAADKVQGGAERRAFYEREILTVERSLNGVRYWQRISRSRCSAIKN
jgi:hypothetical protein